MAPDLRLLQWVAAHRSEALTHVARVLMHAGEARSLGIGLVVLFVLGIAAGQVGAIWVAIAAGGTADALATALKSLIDRPRPPVDLALATATDTSMPSTIAALTAGAAIALVLALRWPSPLARRIAAALIGLVVVLVGAAMVYLGAHWMTDVVVGWALGAGVAVLFGVGFARLTRR